MNRKKYRIKVTGPDGKTVLFPNEFTSRVKAQNAANAWNGVMARKGFIHTVIVK